jgi:hypothetical protein
MQRASIRGIIVRMPRRSSEDRDFFVTARHVVEQAIGEQMDGKPLPEPKAAKRGPYKKRISN